MAINPSKFYLYNMIDTCAIWNILSSQMLFSRASQSGVEFYCTEFVIYECLYKIRKIKKEYDEKLQKRLSSLIEQCKFVKYSLDVDDLHQIDALYNRKRLGKGELSSIAFAMKSQLAFLSDDQKARKLALDVLPTEKIQTTPHLFSWLIFAGKISDSEKSQVIEEHQSYCGDISEYLEQAYLEGCRCRYGVHNSSQRE
jgi:predicted nucleic acid-binding protein